MSDLYPESLTTTCPHCGDVKPNNFCGLCGKKMVEVCHCHYIDYREFNCGYEKCPKLSEFFKEFGNKLFPSE